jgi:hypothetical protein
MDDRTGAVITAIPVQATAIPALGSAFRLDRAIADPASDIAVTEVTQSISEVTGVTQDFTEATQDFTEATQAITEVITKRQSRLSLQQESESSETCQIPGILKIPGISLCWLFARTIRFYRRRLRASQAGAFFGRGLIDAVPANGLLRSCSLAPV